MTCDAEFTDELGQRQNDLSEAEQVSIDAAVRPSEEKRPNLRSPRFSGVLGLKHSHMRELRIQHAGHALPEALRFRSSMLSDPADR